MSEPLTPPENRAIDTGIKAGEPPLQTPSTELAYQPISAWAVAGFVTGSLFALLVVVTTAVALIQGAPMFLPSWFMIMAVLGIVFSLLGQRQVRLAEGTRAGGKLARLGLWLSVVSGLAYLSYSTATELAVQTQANAFVMDKGEGSGFFPLLLEGAAKPSQLNAAFLLTLPAYARSGRPDDQKAMAELHDTPGKDGIPGNLTQFKEGTFPRLFFKDLAKDAVITPLSVQSLVYEQRSYKVARNYLVKTKELEVEMHVVVASTEAEAAGQGRQWFVDMNKSGALPKTMNLTKVGEGVKLLRGNAHGWLLAWIAALNGGAAFPAIRDKDQSAWDQMNVKGVKSDTVRAAVHEAFAASNANRIMKFTVLTGPNDVGKWEQVGDKLRIYHGIRFALAKEPGGPPYYNLDGYAVLETKNALDPARFDFNSPPPDWELVRLFFTQATVPPERKGP